MTLEKEALAGEAINIGDKWDYADLLVQVGIIKEKEKEMLADFRVILPFIFEYTIQFDAYLQVVDSIYYAVYFKIEIFLI